MGKLLLLEATLSVTAVKSSCSHQKRSKKNVKQPFVGQRDWFPAPPSLDMRAAFSCLPCGLWEFFSACLCIHQRFYTCLIVRSADHNQASGLGSPFGPQALGRTHPLLRRDRFQEVLVTSTSSVIEIIGGHPWV